MVRERFGTSGIESKVLWELTFFLLLQQWFSTISLKEPNPDLLYDIVREPHKNLPQVN